MIRRPPRSALFPNTTLFRSTGRFRFAGSPGPSGDPPAPVDIQATNERLVLCDKRLDDFVTVPPFDPRVLDRKSTRLNSSHQIISYAVFCFKKKTPDTKTRI